MLRYCMDLFSAPSDTYKTCQRCAPNTSIGTAAQPEAWRMDSGKTSEEEELKVTTVAWTVPGVVENTDSSQDWRKDYMDTKTIKL